MKKVVKVGMLGVASAFQLCGGVVVFALLVHDLAVGRFNGCGWLNVAGAVLACAVFGAGAIISGVGYGALAWHNVKR